MDPITQGALGATTSQTFLGKKIPASAWWLGVLGGIAADSDIFIRSSQNPTLFMLYHRHFTHSLFFVPFGAVIVSLLVLLFFKSQRKIWPWVFLAVFLGYATHGILDAMTSYGTVFYWPFSNKRIAMDIISIVDPIFTIPLIIGVYASIKLKSRLPAVGALLFAACYLGVGVAQHHRAIQAQALIAKERGQTIVRGRVIPMIATINHWHSFYIANDNIYLDHIDTPFFATPTVKSLMTIKLFTENDLPEAIKTNKILMHDFQTFKWFSDGYIAMYQKHPLILMDLRYIRFNSALWGIEFSPGKSEHVKWLRNLKLNHEYKRRNLF